MPVPISFIRFRKKHGRNPRPDELTLPERRVLRKCCIQNRDRARRNAEAVEIFEKLEKDPKNWHRLLTEVPEPTRSLLQRRMMEEGVEKVVQEGRAVFELFKADVDPEYWERVLKESVALE